MKINCFAPVPQVVHPQLFSIFKFPSKAQLSHHANIHQPSAFKPARNPGPLACCRLRQNLDASQALPANVHKRHLELSPQRASSKPCKQVVMKAPDLQQKPLKTIENPHRNRNYLNLEVQVHAWATPPSQAEPRVAAYPPRSCARSFALRAAVAQRKAPKRLWNKLVRECHLYWYAPTVGFWCCQYS